MTCTGPLITLLSAFTEIKFLHRVSADCWQASYCAQQLSTIGTNFLVMIPQGTYSLGHSHCGHWPFMKAPQCQKKPGACT